MWLLRYALRNNTDSIILLCENVEKKERKKWYIYRYTDTQTHEISKTKATQFYYTIGLNMYMSNGIRAHFTCKTIWKETSKTEYDVAAMPLDGWRSMVMMETSSSWNTGWSADTRTSFWLNRMPSLLQSMEKRAHLWWLFKIGMDNIDKCPAGQFKAIISPKKKSMKEIVGR